MTITRITRHPRIRAHPDVPVLEPPHGNQYLGRGQDAHHHSMGTRRAR